MAHNAGEKVYHDYHIPNCGWLKPHRTGTRIPLFARQQYMYIYRVLGSRRLVDGVIGSHIYGCGEQGLLGGVLRMIHACGYMHETKLR